MFLGSFKNSMHFAIPYIGIGIWYTQQESLQILPLATNSALQKHFQVQEPPINISSKTETKIKY